MSIDAEPSGELLLAEVTVPHTELVRSFQEAGQAAWTKQLEGTRTPEEVAYVYDPTDPDHLEAQAEGIRQKAQDGGVYLALAHAEGGEVNMVGYAAAFSHMSGNGLARAIKGHVFGREPYVEISIVNVVPGFQRKGHGGRLLMELTNRFGETQHPTAYVFDENQVALGYFQRRGFVFSPSREPQADRRKKPQTPTPQKDYFGPGTEPAQQWRLEAPEGAGELRSDINHIAIVAGHQALPVRQMDQLELSHLLAEARAKRED